MQYLSLPPSFKQSQIGKEMEYAKVNVRGDGITENLPIMMWFAEQKTFENIWCSPKSTQGTLQML